MSDTKQKQRVILVYTGDSKGKTSASLGLTVRALGAGHKVAFIQFIKLWDVSEHAFIQKIMPLFEDSLDFYKGGLGFFEAGELSSTATQDEHIAQARTTYDFAFQAASSGKYQLVVCDEINNAVHDGLLSVADLKQFIQKTHSGTSLCMSGRNFPKELLPLVDIATEMKKIKHHYDEGFIANKGIDY